MKEIIPENESMAPANQWPYAKYIITQNGIQFIHRDL